MKDILITQQKIKAWEQEKAKLEASIKANQERLFLLMRRLENISLYVERGDQVPVGESATTKIIGAPGQSPSELSPPAAVQAILKAADKPISAGEIKTELTKANYPVSKFGKSFGYLYTLLGRLVSSGAVVKVDRKYKLA